MLPPTPVDEQDARIKSLADEMAPGYGFPLADLQADWVRHNSQAADASALGFASHKGGRG